MGTQITVRLDHRLAEELEAIAERTGLRRSHIVRAALAHYLEEHPPTGGSDPFLTVRDLLGSVHSGVPDLGENHRDHLRKKLRP
ncbi:MAG: ribbon-helix-helix domain-containing protein [Candidatus Dadabacteria bacterium]|nr:MAG: ribbon-helix-helix domain-containing protein [Candidatus Dadabacteria bacterium]